MIQNTKQITINLDMMPAVQCGAVLGDGDKCACVKFVKSFQVKKISALVSGAGRDQFAQIEYLHCASCGQVKVLK